MAAMNLKHSLRLIALSAALVLVGCGGDDEEAPPPKPDSGSITDEPEDAGEEPDAEEESDGGTQGDGGDDEDTLRASAAEAEKNGWVEGCYKKPSKSEELLNSCAASWRKFDTKLYPASWKAGELPALP
jgi:hypothetical protein